MRRDSFAGFSKVEHGPFMTGAGGRAGIWLALSKGFISHAAWGYPPNINLTKPNQKRITWEGQQNDRKSHPCGKARKSRPELNSFGFGGTNAHHVVQNLFKWKKKWHWSPPIALVDYSRWPWWRMACSFRKLAKNLDAFYHTIYNGESTFLPTSKNMERDGSKTHSVLKKVWFWKDELHQGRLHREFEMICTL